MRNTPMSEEAIIKAAELYLEPRATWQSVSVQLNKVYKYPKWCVSTISKKVKRKGLIPECICPICKKENTPDEKNNICISCLSNGSEYHLAIKRKSKTESTLQRDWLSKKIL